MRKQTQVTLRFAVRLTSHALASVREHILAQGLFGRQIGEALARATIGEPLNICIDPASLRATTGEEAESVLATSGMSIVASGYPEEAARLIGLLPLTLQRQARILLIRGYADYMRGRFQTALGYLAEASADKKSITSEDAVFLAFLINACEQQLGLIGVGTYFGRIREIEKATSGPIALLMRLGRSYEEFVRELRRDERASLRAELRGTVDEILGTDRLPAWLKVHARLVNLRAEAAESIAEEIREKVLTLMRVKIGEALMPDGLERVRASLCQWEREVEQAWQEAEGLGHPLLMGEALLTRLGVRLRLLTNEKLVSVFAGTPFSVQESVSAAMLADGEAATAIFKQADMLDEELCARWRLQILKRSVATFRPL